MINSNVGGRGVGGMYDDDEINWVDQVDGAEGGGERLAG